MEPTCHRCHGVVIEATPYCPHCGAPQLIMNAYAQPLSSAIEAAALAAGHRPAGFSGAARGVSGSTDWHVAVIAALQVAGFGAVLMVIARFIPAIAALSPFWLSLSAMLTVGLYHRRSPKALLNGGVGARIGFVVGLFLSAISVSINAVECVVYRLVLKQPNPLISGLPQSGEQLMTFYRSSGKFDAEMLAQLQQSVNYFLTPSGMATVVLLVMLSSCAFILLFCLVTGAIGGRMMLRRQNPV